MFDPLYINATNFMSYEELHLKFDQGESTLIYGKNLDDDGADSNGSGKSAIIKAITVAMLGIPDTSLNKEDYIKDGTPRAILRMGLSNKVIGKVLDIERVVQRSSSMKLTIWVDGEEQEQLTSVAEGDRFILELLDISKEDILNYFIINQDNSHSFFEATDTQQKRIVSRFTNLDPVDQAITAVKQDISVVREEMDAENILIEKSLGKIEAIKESIKYEKEGRANEQKENIKAIKSDIAEERAQIEELEERLSKYAKKIEEATKSIESTPQPTDTKESKDKITKYEASEAKVQRELKEAKKLRNDLELSIAGTITCPKCGHEWVEGDEDVDIEDTKETIKSIDQILINLRSSQDKFKSYIEKHERKIKDSKKQQHTLNDLKSTLDDSESSLKTVEKRLKSSADLVREYKRKLAKLDSISVDRERIDQLTNEVDSEMTSVEERQEKVAKMKLNEESLIFWEVKLGIKGFKTYLVNTVLDSLEGYVNHHLNQFRTNLKIKINGYRVKKDGDISDKIDVLVSRDGDSWKKYNRHSGGQRARINVCGILTIHRLINMSSKSGGLNMLLLDEFFEGLDVSGQIEILNILRESQITNLVISHNNADIGAVKQKWVRYQGGISKLLDQPES